MGGLVEGTVKGGEDRQWQCLIGVEQRWGNFERAEAGEREKVHVVVVHFNCLRVTSGCDQRRFCLHLSLTHYCIVHV